MIPLKEHSWFDACNWTTNSEQVKLWDPNSISVKLIKKSLIERIDVDGLPSEDSFKGGYFSEIKKATSQAYEILTNFAHMAFYGNFRAMVIKNGEISTLPVKLKFYGEPFVHLLSNSSSIREVLKEISSKNENSYFSIPVTEIFKLYSDQNFTQEDIAVVEENKIYRQLLMQFMNKSIEQHKSEIGDLCAHFIKNLQEKSTNSYINISDECRIFTVSIISKYIFGDDLDRYKAIEISIAINKLMYLFMQKDLGKKVESIGEYFCYAKQISDEILISLENSSLRSNSIVKFMEEKGYTHKQILVMVIKTLGTAADDFSEFLSYVLMQLALNLPIQKKMLIDKGLIKKIVAESLRMFNSHFALKRHLEEDSVMMIKNLETKEIYPYYMVAGEKIICVPNSLSSCQDKFEQPSLFDPETHQEHKDKDADLYTFGCNENMCPAKKLCLVIAKSLVSKFSELNFFVIVNFSEPIPLCGSCTTKLENDLYGKVVKKLEFYDF